MKSISGKNWEEVNISKRLLEKVSFDHNFSIFQSKHIISNKFSNEEIYSINNNLNFKNPFFKNRDFLLGCALLKDHICKKNEILVIGDYDVDGCVSTSLMVNFLIKCKANVSYYIPDRIKDGYGADKVSIDRLVKRKKPKLVIFLDCGSNSHETLKFLENIRIQVLIIDHHNIQKKDELNHILINPKKNSSYKYFDHLCSSFLTYLFLEIYIELNKLKLKIKDELIYVLLATITDIMPLRGINRLLSINLLKNFNINNNFIFDNLFKLHNIKKKIELDDLGFFIGPILNSAGRLENANQVVELLTIKSKPKILQILKNIYKLNLRRKVIENRYLNNINFKFIDKQKGVIFIYEPNIPEGIIGIIAAKIKEYYDKPCMVFTDGPKSLKGSARSTSNFNIGEYINEALKLNLILSGGGHNLAAGVTLSKKNLDLFKKFLDKFYKQNKKINFNEFNSRISLSAIDINFAKDIKILGPFGNKNTNPIFLIENIRFVNSSILKDRFVSCYIKSNNKMIRAISFHHIKSKINYEILNSKKKYNVLVKVKENKWNNKTSVQLEIIDIIKSINNT